MRTKLVVIMAAVLVLATAMAGPAAAKGASGGSIEGEGLDAPISLDSMGEGMPGGMTMMEDVGFFAATFGQAPNPTLANLIGHIEPMSGAGSATDFLAIRPGALHEANGGALTIEARRVLAAPEAWDGLKRALERICKEAEGAIDSGYSMIVLSDRSMGPNRVPVSTLLACGAVHHHLVARAKRTRSPNAIKVSSERVKATRYLPPLSSFSRSACTKASTTSFSSSPPEPRVPVSMPPCPASRTIRGRESPFGFSGASLGLIATL